MELEPANAETLYRSLWHGEPCGATALTIAGIASLVVVGVVLVIGVGAWLALRRRGAWARRSRLVIGSLAGLALVLIAVVGYASFSVSPLQRVAVAGDTLYFRRCAGLTPTVERVARGHITRFAFRQSRTGGKSPRLVDELAIVVSGRSEPLVVPLSRDRETLDHALLAQLVPREVLMQWAAALRERGLSLPEGLGVLTGPASAP